ncbi:D-alanyl-D-alanine carboxypeptidase family protein [Pararhodobacter aggregans]|uniref:serine-type D-Ala-D-Ala carboxypeptidase n=1 Tax=Pararhodobacter aggregans TaxID=404875 RepID=A0A2T7UN96_9RHOB|nr:D-alanyl-D-alanine carboxypeptidase family protein [Pararhodobacter aggregans]PTW98837.1 D-alanyl-D-alanine carboxypeptidase (penicillin-binding protein 5/6) [Pararhodobacter aggregans]PVE46162.1 D-alanyl-D-alanine carboxypeptidase [Pararhodobacter aggregans]
MPLMRLLIATALLLAGTVAGFAQSPYGGRAPNYFILDVASGQILAQQNADIPLPPASMSKLMTLAMLLDALDQGRITLETTWSVSERAHAMGGSSMFLETRDRPTTEDLIRGLAVVSGNDAAVVIAEGLGGTEDSFAQMAQARAAQIGMTQTTIANSSGWPDPRHRMSLHDLGMLGRYLMVDHAEYYHYLAETEFTWNDITQPNRLPLLSAGIGMDGLKTGHTEEAGYSMVGSAHQGNRRIIFVFSGLNSTGERAEEAERIVNWAFRQFVEREVLESGQSIAEAEVWLGTAPTVPLVASQSLTVLMPAIEQGPVSARVEYDGPLAAPVQEGAEVARLIVEVPGLPDAYTMPLVAGASVPEGGIVPRMRTAAMVLGNQLGLTAP